jgi:uncharacterized repeat protein (TIGR01451 family)
MDVSPRGTFRLAWRAALTACLVALLSGGCASWRIDPTGEHFFIPDNQPPAAVVAPPPPGTLAPPFVPGAVAPAPAIAAPLPTGPLQAPPVYPDTSLSPPIPVGPPTAIGPPLPPGVAPTSVVGPPLVAVPIRQDRVIISPDRVMAPIGSEVVLRAGICTARGYLLADQRVEWLLAKEGAGQIVDLNNRGEFDLLSPPWDVPRKIDNWYAIGSTANFPTTLRRNVADPTDDVQIQRGEAWISVTSPTEGACFVTAYSPEVSDWQQRRAIATIYWVDAQWVFAPSAVEEPGRAHVLTTTVTRRSNGTAVQGWIVRYEVAGPGGSLGYSAGKSVEVPTDAAGRASVEVSPTDVGGGSASVNMTLVRPATTIPVASPQLEVGRGVATITWGTGAGSAAPLAAPAPITSSPISPPPTFASPSPSTSSPPPPLQPAPLQPGPAQPIGSAPAEPYASSVQPPPPRTPDLRVQVTRTSPEQVNVGDFAKFDVLVTNRGTGPAHKIEVLDQFDHGLKHPQAQPNEFAVKYPGMKDLAPGESATVPLTFEVIAPGRQCHQVTVSADAGNPATDRGCIMAVTPAQAATPIPNAAPNANIAPNPGVPGTLEVLKVAPLRHFVGELAKFKTVVKNSGQVPVTHVEVLDQYDAAFDPRFIDAGSETAGTGKLLWRIDRLEVGERREFNVQAACVSPATSACSRVTVSADGGLNYTDQKCVEIQPLPPSQ